MMSARTMFGLLILSALLHAQTRTSEKMECGDLPDAVKTQARKQIRQETATCQKISDNHSLLYLLRVTNKSGKVRRLTFRSDGQLAEFEEEGDLARIPSAARATILKETASGELRKVDLIHRGGAVLYEGEYRVEGARKKVVVDANGVVISR